MSMNIFHNLWLFQWITILLWTFQQ